MSCKHHHVLVSEGTCRKCGVQVAPSHENRLNELERRIAILENLEKLRQGRS